MQYPLGSSLTPRSSCGREEIVPGDVREQSRFEVGTLL